MAMVGFTWQFLKQKLFFWLHKSQENDHSHKDLVPLPDTLEAELLQSINSLATPSAYTEAIHAALEDSLKAWQKNLEAPNSLVILANPVEPITKILQDSLQGWENNLEVTVVKPLGNFRRPPDPLTITGQLRRALEAQGGIEFDGQGVELSQDVACLEQRTTVVVIPSLEQCFLRCISGWDGIGFLREITVHNPQYFWLIGCNSWAWDFLDFVGQISAYFDDVRPLPTLTGEMLQSWLAPLTEQWGTTTNNEDLADPVSADPASSDDQKEVEVYWQSLADCSQGVSSIAAKLWLRSLRIEKQVMETEDPAQLVLNTKENEDQISPLSQVNPAQPSLPSLTNLDLYLLHSLMIHGRISPGHLALSLGEPESQIQARVQWLLREDILERRWGDLIICPTYYQQLQSELANNNFFVGGR
ncbi:AsnC family protein [Synechocystis salina LEGE 00031]|uniref:AsnC family protein n=2 Tax=Synechocystis TaxID=1142 RepID=A0ABR9VU87_9SYNC|nr:AsnC family protein [Synechocystis salina LEGE 00041]MBE9254925.1 AsnC family protein [Synechocystis salina LEGE 00031]